jgi:hypothetical protein
VHNESSVAVAVQRSQFGNSRKGTSTVRSRYPRTGGTSYKEDSVPVFGELQTVCNSDSAI